MDTWNSDRIYNWLASAISRNKSTNQKFYFDYSDKTFFYLIDNNNNNQYTLDDENTFSTEEVNLLISKVNKIAKNDSSLFEIKKSNKDYSHLFDQTTSYENYTKREEQWAAMHEEIIAFLTLHSINLQDAILIE